MRRSPVAQVRQAVRYGGGPKTRSDRAVGMTKTVTNETSLTISNMPQVPDMVGDLVADMAACIASERGDLSHQTSAGTTSRSIDLAQKPFPRKRGEYGVLTGRYFLG
jgi:hypothetical protein